MALGTIVSRATGFARTAALVAVLGVGGVRQAFEVANTLPNSLYDLLLGGVLSSILVPLLVAARTRNQLQDYTQRLLTLVMLVLLVITAAAMALAPVLVHLYSQSRDPQQIDLAVTWAWFFLPQIFFYGVSAVLGGVLNTRDRFAAPVWAPVLNNLVVIATLGLFAVMPGPAVLEPGTMTSQQRWVLGLGTTLGVVTMTAALLPSVRASGISWRLRLDVRGMGLRRVAQMAGWSTVYVTATGAGFLVLTRLASEVDQLPLYVTAFTVWQLPYAVVAVSVTTALLPRMSAHAVEKEFALVRSDLNRGLRLVTLIVLPTALALIVLGGPVAATLFAHGATSYRETQRIGAVLAILAVGLVAFSRLQVQLRAFYALSDTRTPALVQVFASGVLIVVDLVAAAQLPDPLRVYGLAAGLVASHVAGTLASTLLLRHRLPAPPAAPASSRPGTRLSTVATLGVAGAAAAAGWAAGSWALATVLPSSWAATWYGAAVVLVVVAPIGFMLYVVALLLGGVEEARTAVVAVQGRLRPVKADSKPRT